MEATIGFRGQGLGSRVHVGSRGLGSRVWGVGFRRLGLGLRV